MMTIGAQVAIGVRPGYATASTCKMIVASLANRDVTINCNGVNYVVAMTRTDTDGSPATPAGYTGYTTITGLSAFTRYTYTVTQTGNSGSSSGSFMTAPNANSDFSFFFSGCDNGLSSAAGTGFWNKVHDYALNGALPTVGHVFVDDHGYVAEMNVDDTGYSGLKTSSISGAYVNGRVFDYALGYIAALGMLGNTGSAPVAFGRNADRIWCNQNLNYIPQWGDHEFANDIGWDFPVMWASPPTTCLPASVATGATMFTSGKAAWDAFHLQLQPPSRGSGISSLDATANHWGLTWGCVNIVAPDGFTNANGQWNHGNGATGGLTGSYPSVLFGSNQIKDCLNFLNNSPQPFNIWGMCYGIRYLDNTSTVYSSGTQHPIYDGVLAEYQQLFTAIGNTPKSVMDSNQTNGNSGVTVTVHGDYHRQMVTHNQKAAYTGNSAENFYSVWNGTTNGSTNFPFAQSGVTNGTVTPGVAPTAGSGYSYGGTTLTYNSAWVQPSAPGTGHRWGGCRIDVYGSKPQKEMHIVLMDELGTEMWHGRWLERSSNEVVPVDWVMPSISMGASL
jgi:hypothetical protein